MTGSGTNGRPRIRGAGARRGAFSAAALSAILAALILPAIAGAAYYKPPDGKIWSGVSDTGKLEDFNRFKEATGKHPAILQTFHSWGTKPGRAYNRWRAARARPVLHISTTEGYGGREEISPRGIARGNGDDYLIRLNRFFGGEKKLIGYIRPLAEMNGYRNPYCAFNGNGTRRDGAHTTKQFKRAWRRIVIIIRGGGSTTTINRRLKAQDLPKLRPREESLDGYMEQAPVSFMWTPQYFGSPNVRGNQPPDYFPGKRWVDWVGTDFYSNYPFWKQFKQFYARYDFKPFVIGEWGVTGHDQPDFIAEFMNWVNASRKRVRMNLYYQGFNGDAYSPYRYPQSLSKLRSKLSISRYPPFTPEYAP